MINFYNKLFLNKNLNLCLKNKNKNFIFKINKKCKLTKIVALRAPKHFKVGRHHYQILKQFVKIFIKKPTNFYFIKKNKFYFFINFIKKFVELNTITRPFTYTNTIKITLTTKDKFYIY